jgi:hypothetical protein
MSEASVSSDLPELRQKALQYLASMRDGDTWAFRFSEGNPPTLIAASVAGMLGGFLGYAKTLPDDQRLDWADYLKGFQNRDGWFEDEDIDDDHRLEWYGRDRALFHRTRHALCALYALGERPRHSLRMVEQWLGKGRMRQWLDTLDLSDYWYASNMMMDAYLLLSDEYNQSHGKAEFDAIMELIDFCDDCTDPKTGYHDRGLSETRNAMAGAMHLYPAYFLTGREPKYPEAVVRTTLDLQREDGLFGFETGTGGEDCLDYDATLILANFYFLAPQCQTEIKSALGRCRDAIAICANDDGGFACHRRDEVYNFGTKTTLVAPGQSSLWATYSRLMTIAMITELLNPGTSPFTLGHNLMEVWDGGTDRMTLCPARVKKQEGKPRA